MTTDRDALYDHIIAEHERRGGSILPREEFDERMEKQKAYTMGRLATRRCPMTLEGAGKVAGGYSAGNNEMLTWRFRVCIAELVEEGKLIETHRPDGNDTYHIPGGTWEPVTISPQEADLVLDLLSAESAFDPRAQELRERLEQEAIAR